jgi:hypothetical protein
MHILTKVARYEVGVQIPYHTVQVLSIAMLFVVAIFRVVGIGWC